MTGKYPDYTPTCENGHPMSMGEFRCKECGERMRTASVAAPTTIPAQADSAPIEPAQADAAPDTEAAESQTIGGPGNRDPEPMSLSTSEGNHGGPLVRVCRKCSTQTETTGDFCPRCGKSYTRRSISSMSARSKIIAGALLGILLVGGATTAIVAAHNRNAQIEADKAASDLAAKAEEEQASADEDARETRRTAVTQMEESITADAKKKVSQGLINGPIKYTSCDALGGGSTDDLTAITTTFTCIAVNKENDDGTASGYSFSATMNWTEGSYSWQLGS